jgi:arylsulfatase A-like enzyme
VPPLNVLLLVIDSLRKRSLVEDGPRTPFFDRLGRESVCFTEAHATECWTLPSHLSMFTGLLPSQHGAHFATMRYEGAPPTIAEWLRASGYSTEVLTRNTIFDGRLPGATRGFERNTLTQVALPTFSPAAWFVALTKPRLRRQVRNLGFFSPEQKESLAFLRSYARSLFPADQILLEQLLDRLREQRETGRPGFLFANLYDVHAPYPPTEDSIVWPVRSLDDLLENLFAFHALPKISSHAYLRDGFSLPARSRQALLRRYHRAVELADRKLAAFFAEADSQALLDDTLVIVTSDHGEAFGEHELYLHDASVYDVHLSVPLWVRHPRVPAQVVDDVVSLADLFGLMQSAPTGEIERTILAASFREQRPIALAEHFHYPRLPKVAPRFRQDVTAALSKEVKVIVRGEGTFLYDRLRDPLEKTPHASSVEEFQSLARRAGYDPSSSVFHHLSRWRTGQGEKPWA